MNLMKIFLWLRDFVIPCLWLLRLKNCLRAYLLWQATTYSRTGFNTWWLLTILQTDIFEDLPMTGLLTLKEQSDLSILNGVV